MTPNDALKFVKQLAQSALAGGAYKNFETAQHASDAVKELEVCVDTQNKKDQGLLVHPFEKEVINGQQQQPAGAKGDTKQ